MNNEIERIAQHNDMSVEFVTWFFNEKKSACGEHWFLVLGAMWEGWKGRGIEMDRMAAENVALKATSDDRRMFIMNGVQLGYIKVPTVETDPALETIRIAVSPQETTPATDRIVAEAEARGVEKFAAHLRANDNGTSVCKMIALGADDFAKQLREGADK